MKITKKIIIHTATFVLWFIMAVLEIFCVLFGIGGAFVNILNLAWLVLGAALFVPFGIVSMIVDRQMEDLNQ